MMKLLSTLELSRKADTPYQTLIRAIRAGEVIPDAVSGRFYFFEERRLPEILASLNLRRGAHVETNAPTTIF
jgi:hypothetical protein